MFLSLLQIPIQRESGRSRFRNFINNTFKKGVLLLVNFNFFNKNFIVRVTDHLGEYHLVEMEVPRPVHGQIHLLFHEGGINSDHFLVCLLEKLIYQAIFAGLVPE